MPAPILDTTTSVLGFRQGELWQYQPATTNAPAPTSWDWSGLPPGVTANATTGRITGPATAPGVFVARVTATNGDGTSQPMMVPIGILEGSVAEVGAVPVNVDVRTGTVYPHGRPEWQPGQPVAWVKDGDSLLLDVGFTADGGESMLMLDPVILKVGLKETDGGGVLDLSDGDFTVVGEWDRTRYRLVCVLDDLKIRRALRGYEQDAGTEFAALAEIKWTQAVVLDAGSTTLVRSSRTFAIQVARKLLP